MKLDGGVKLDSEIVWQIFYFVHNMSIEKTSGFIFYFDPFKWAFFSPE